MISGDDLDAFGYWEMVDAYPPREKTVREMVEEYRVVAGQEKNPSVSAVLVQEEFEEWWWSSFPGNMDWKKEEDLKELADLVYVIYGYANSLGWNLGEAVRRVHENNMGRMYQPDGTIKRREDGKILKNPEYLAVKLDDLV
jgi:NTP pyrophosphatase (non-canonical NTP hydrolase)